MVNAYPAVDRGYRSVRLHPYGISVNGLGTRVG